MTCDDRYKLFIFRYDLESEESNESELQALFDDGWQIDMSENPITHKGIVRVIIYLNRSAYDGKDD